MRPGKLRYPVDIEERTTEQDPVYGTTIETWSVLVTVWANVTGVSGREFFAAHAVQSETVYRFTLRYCKDLKSTMRLVHQGERYNITAILPDDRQEYMTVMCDRL